MLCVWLQSVAKLIPAQCIVISTSRTCDLKPHRSFAVPSNVLWLPSKLTSKSELPHLCGSWGRAALLVWGQGVGLAGEDEGKLRNCSRSRPVNYCSFPACMKGTMWITSIVIIFLHYSVHLLFTVNIPGRRDKPRLHFKNPESQSVLCLSFWRWSVRMGQGCHQISRSIFKLWGQILKIWAAAAAFFKKNPFLF